MVWIQFIAWKMPPIQHAAVPLSILYAILIVDGEEM